MTRIPPSELGDTTANRIMGHRPELLAAWESLKHALVGSSSTLSPELKEQVRRTLALHTGCEFCASLGRPAAEQPNPKDSLAVAFAEAVAIDHTAISDGQLEVLFEELTIPQVVELLTWIVFEYAGQMFGALIGDEPASAEQRAAFGAATSCEPVSPSTRSPRIGSGDPSRHRSRPQHPRTQPLTTRALDRGPVQRRSGRPVGRIATLIAASACTRGHVAD